MKKALSILLVLCLTLSLLPAALAEGDYAGKTVILYTANLAGDLGLYPLVAAAKADYAAKGADVVLVDAGNYLRGSAAANTTRGAAVYDLMDAVGYDAAAMGLAEFSFGPATTGMIYHGNLTRYYTQAMLQDGTEEVTYNVNRDGSQTGTLAAREGASFAALSANVTAGASYSFEASAIVETASGLKLGVWAVTDPAVLTQVQDGLISEILPDPAAPKLDADVTLCLSNASGFETDAADILVDGSGDTVSCGAYVIDNATKEVTAEEVDLSSYTPDEAVKALADAAIEAAGEAALSSLVLLNGADSVGWTSETGFGDLVTDALLWYAENYFDGIDTSLPMVAIQNGGNIDQFLYPGAITDTDLLCALPFSPMGVGALVVTGQELLETLEAAACPSDDYGEACPGFAQVAGLTYTLDLNADYDAGEAYGKFFRADSVSRVTITEVNGAAFDPEARYLLIADNYLMNGNDTYYVLKDAKEAEGAAYVNNGGGVKVRDMVAMYIEKKLDGVVGDAYAAPQGRITVIPKSPFADVTDGSLYYYDAMLWAYEKGVTTGTDKGFEPALSCTRDQVVTFLWRAVGSPAPETAENPFADAEEGSWYYDAMLWAFGSGITNGTDKGFEPKKTCTRAEIVLMLHRALGAPEAAGGTELETASWNAEAIAWADNAGLLAGTDEPYAGGANCPRQDIVTYMYRALVTE